MIQFIESILCCIKSLSKLWCRIKYMSSMRLVSCVLTCLSVSKYDGLEKFCVSLHVWERTFLFTYCEWFETSSTNLSEQPLKLNKADVNTGGIYVVGCLWIIFLHFKKVNGYFICASCTNNFILVEVLSYINPNCVVPFDNQLLLINIFFQLFG